MLLSQFCDLHMWKMHAANCAIVYARDGESEALQMLRDYISNPFQPAGPVVGVDGNCSYENLECPRFIISGYAHFRLPLKAHMKAGMN